MAVSMDSLHVIAYESPSLFALLSCLKLFGLKVPIFAINTVFDHYTFHSLILHEDRIYND